MALHDNIGENDSIDSEESPLEIVAYEPREVKAERPDERSDAQRIEEDDPEMQVGDNADDIEVSPHAVWKPKKEGEEEEEESEEEEETSETPDDEEEEESEEQEEEESEEVKEETKPAKKKKKYSVDPVQKRINKITREKYDAKREAERLAKELAAAKKKLKSVEFEKKKSSLSMEKPKEDDFDTEAEYYEALGRWGAKVEIHESQTPPVEEEEEITDPFEAARNRIITEGKETYPDFEEIVLDDNLPISPVMVEAAMDSKYAPDIFYLLAQSPDRAAKIAKMRSPAQVAREIGRIESEFLDDEFEEVVSHDPSMDDESIEKSKKKKTKKKGKSAPPPVKPIGSRGKVKKSLDDMSLADYYEARGFDRSGFKKSRIP